ncbi:peptidyl-tRNA hydrolase Pth2 [Candidatus Woesearchaeota archaeon]|nr:peptidyl-tRNA hydrolase Pth2 [Candidatus Woesearchaeota archaeon]
MKQVIVIRNDLKLPKGKLAAQVAHASTEAALRTARSVLERWRAQGMKKVVLKVETVEELREIERVAKRLKLVTAMVMDAGHTVVEPGTITCLGIGPDSEEKINQVTGSLKMV